MILMRVTWQAWQRLCFEKMLSQPESFRFLGLYLSSAVLQPDVT
jgi:hypothetical protein